MHVFGAADQELTLMGQESDSQDMQKFDGDPLELARWGIDYMRQKAVSEAVQCFAAVLQSHDMAAKNKVGQWYFKKGDYGTAIQYFQQTGSGIYISYDSACAWSNLGAVHIKLNNLEQARDCLEHATMLFDGIQKKDVDIQQSALLATFNLGLVHWHLGAKYDAWNCWGKVAEHSYCYASLHAITDILLKEDKFDDAKPILERMYKMKDLPPEVSAHVANNLGVIACKKLQVAQARQYFEHASELGHAAAKKNLSKLPARTVEKGTCTFL